MNDGCPALTTGRLFPSPGALAWLGLCWLTLAGVAEAQAPVNERRDRTTPGLVLSTGARTGACDALLFTQDGGTLLACGDDKVVREWPVGPAGFPEKRSRDLRWPVYREQRGSIFALALSPDEKLVAVGGFGVRSGEVMVLDRATGAVVHRMDEVPGDQVVWRAAFSPSGKTLVYGSEKGDLYAWRLGQPTAELLPGSLGKVRNRVRLVAFQVHLPGSTMPEETKFVSVAEDGVVRQWDLTGLEASPRELGRLPSSRVFRAAVAPVAGAGPRWLAAISEAAADRLVVVPLGDWLAGKGGAPRVLRFGADELPHAVAFSADGTTLAVGVRVEPLPTPERGFIRETAGRVHVLRDFPRNTAPSATVETGVRPEQLAFRPGRAGQLATAGGDDHEVRLWDVSGPGRLLDVIQGPGSSVWNLSLSPDGQTLGFQTARNPDPSAPGDYGTGPWRVLQLRGPARKLGAAPPGYLPTPPVRTLGGYKVGFRDNGRRWEVIDPDGVATVLGGALYDADVNNLPRCYTFLPARPGAGPGRVRLVVGHTWGASIYDCGPKKDVRLARVLVGHEGDVMAVAATADGRVLVTASRDQTVCGWSLEDWPTQPELGASFVVRGGKLTVDKVDPGSPAWEMGLSDGDALAGFFSGAGEDHNGSDDDFATFHGLEPGGKVLTAAQAVERLARVRANEEVLFSLERWTTRRAGDPFHPVVKATVRQRPVWRLFATRADDYVIWRWRDYYYATNGPAAERLVGWHVNPGADEPRAAPRFYPLERFGAPPLVKPRDAADAPEPRHNPEKVWAAVEKTTEKPDLVIFPDIEPPRVTLTPATQTVKGGDAAVAIAVTPARAGPRQKVVSATLWLDDYAPPLELKPDAAGRVNVPRQVIERALLRSGENTVRVVAYNAAGGRGEARVRVVNDAPPPVQVRLVGLVAGVNDYTRVKGTTFGNLLCAENDAVAIHRLFEGQTRKAGGLYRQADVKLLKGKEVTARAIRAHLALLNADATLTRDDWLVVSLSGHGARAGGQNGDYYFVCSDTDPADESTRLMAADLARALARIRCHKLVILDTCHSGAAADPVRPLAPESAPLLIFSACRPDQTAKEPAVGRHGLFTRALLEGAGALPAPAGAPGGRDVLAGDLAGWIAVRLPALLAELESEGQTPVFLPARVPLLPVLRRP